MVSKQVYTDNDQHDNNLFDMQTSFSINDIGNRVEKEAKEYFGSVTFKFLK